MRKLIMSITLFVAMTMGAFSQVKLDYTDGKYPEGVETQDWNGWLDYMNLVKRVYINDYKYIYVMKVDDSKVQYPDKTDNQYQPLVNGVKNFNFMIEKKLREVYPQLTIYQVESFDIQMKPNSLLLVPRFEKIDMGNRALRSWVGFGAGAQTMQISLYVVDDEGKFRFNFLHQRKTATSKKYEKAVNNELENFCDDIEDVFEKMK